MELIGAVVVFLLGSCAGVLVALYLQGARRNRLAEQATEQAISAAELTAQHHRELRTQLITMTTAVMERVQLVGGALAAEVRDANTQRRNDLRLVVGLPRASVPGEVPSRAEMASEEHSR